MAELISPSEAEELTQARKLIDEGKLDKAHTLLINFEQKGGHTPYELCCSFFSLLHLQGAIIFRSTKDNVFYG